MKRTLAIVASFLTPASAFAAGVHLTDYAWSCNGFLKCTFGGPPPTDVVVDMTNNLISGVGFFIVTLGVVVFFYGALRMATSRGEEGKEVGKKALIYASVGIAAAMLTGAAISFVRDYIYYLGA